MPWSAEEPLEVRAQVNDATPHSARGTISVALSLALSLSIYSVVIQPLASAHHTSDTQHPAMVMALWYACDLERCFSPAIGDPRPHCIPIVGYRSSSRWQSLSRQVTPWRYLVRLEMLASSSLRALPTPTKFGQSRAVLARPSRSSATSVKSAGRLECHRSRGGLSASSSP